MAKMGEGDARWKVQDLGDGGKNVNGWHWTENDILPVFKQRFEVQFNGDENKVLEAEVAGGSGLKGELICYKLETCTGEAHVNRRKGNKVMVIYEIELKIKWKATVRDAAGEEVSSSKGTYNIPCLDTVDEIDEFEVAVKFNKDNDATTLANAFGKKQGEPKVRAMIVETIKAIQAEAGVGQKIPKEGSNTPSPAAAAAPSAPAPAPAPAPKPAAAPAPSSSSSSSSSAKNNVDSISVKVQFNAPAKEVYECFTVPQRVMAYTQSKCEVGTSPGSKLSLFDGSITGECVSATENEKLVWLWRQAAWPEGKVSTVTLTFEQAAPGSTEVVLKQTGVPAQDVHGNSNMRQVVEEGWKRNVFDRIKMVFGYGTPTFS